MLLYSPRSTYDFKPAVLEQQIINNQYSNVVGLGCVAFNCDNGFYFVKAAIKCGCTFAVSIVAPNYSIIDGICTFLSTDK